MDLEQIKKDLNKFASSGAKVFWKPKKGKNFIRILPPWDESALVFYKAVQLHWVGSKSVLCTPGDCVVCSMLTDPSLAPFLSNKVNTINRFLVNIIDLEDDNVYVWAMPPTIWQAISQFCVDPQWGDLTDLNNGRNLTVIREGEGLKTKYQVIPDPQKVAVDPKYLSLMHDLDKVYQKADPEYVIGLLQDANAEAEPVLNASTLPEVNSAPQPVLQAPQQTLQQGFQQPVTSQTTSPGTAAPQQTLQQGSQQPITSQTTSPGTAASSQPASSGGSSGGEQPSFDLNKVKETLSQLMGK